MIDLHIGDCLTELRKLPDKSVQTCVTSPPYFHLRDYGIAGQIGLEATPEAYVAKLVEVFREVWRVLRDDGTLWANWGDSYNAAGRIGQGTRIGYKQVTNRASANGSDECRASVESLKPKDLIGIPWRMAFALQADGWYLRSDIIYAKPNPMPESVTDRPTKAHEYLFLLSKSERYYYDADAIKEPMTPGVAPPGNLRSYDPGRPDGITMRGNRAEEHLAQTTRNKRSVWTVPTAPFSGAHFATFPPDLIKPCILAGSKPGQTVLDPFAGSGTTGMVAVELGRKALLIELNPEYGRLILERTNITPGLALT